MLWRSVRRDNSSSVEHHLRRTAGDCSRGDGTSDSTLRVEERVVTGPLLRVRVCHKGAAVTRFQSESFTPVLMRGTAGVRTVCVTSVGDLCVGGPPVIENEWNQSEVLFRGCPYV